jgi:hypothetical protein
MFKCNVVFKCGAYFFVESVHGPLIPTPWRKRIASLKRQQHHHICRLQPIVGPLQIEIGWHQVQGAMGKAYCRGYF